MANITIDDLEEDVELDAAAMQALFGGRRGMSSSLSLKFMTGQLEESALVPGLLRTGDLRSDLDRPSARH